MIKKLFLGFVFSMVAVLPFAGGQITAAATPEVKEDAVAWWGGGHYGRGWGGWGGYRGWGGYGGSYGYGFNNYNYYPYSNYSYDCPSCNNYY